MLSFINKYLRRQSKDSPKNTGRDKGLQKQKQVLQDNKEEMLLHFGNIEAPQPCISACYPLFFGLVASNTRSIRASARKTKITTTTRTSRSNFVKSTTSSLFPNINFTNHETLPSLPAAYNSFIEVYQQYCETREADTIRETEYFHLGNYVCFDYTGISLFSYAQMQSSIPSSSSNPPPSSSLLPPFFTISYKSASLKSQARYGDHENGLESTIRRKIMKFLNIDDDDYSMVCTANRTTAFRLIAESYPFDSNKRLLTVYDYESEAVNAMAESAQKKGAKVSTANFTWPGLRINSASLNKKLNDRKKKARGLFVFPLQSRMTGARYPYLWMSTAKDNGWQVVLDACALGPKDMDAFGLSVIKPDFIVCSFFKVLGENPSGFAGLFIKKSSIEVLETSVIARSIGVVSLVPPRSLSQLSDCCSEKDFDQDEVKTTSPFSGPLSTQIWNDSTDLRSSLNTSPQRQKQIERVEQPETSNIQVEEGTQLSYEIVELREDNYHHGAMAISPLKEVDDNSEIECRGLDHAQSLGLLHISNRLRYITNWLVTALLKLRHPHTENGFSLVNIYGPKIKFDRGPALAFNVFDWKGEKVDPALVQKLADRSNISLSCGFLQNIWFPDKYAADEDLVLERRVAEKTQADKKKKENTGYGISVVNASLSFLTNFDDAYRLWTFIAKFLDADFVEKERWRYMALNQKMIEV